MNTYSIEIWRLALVVSTLGLPLLLFYWLELPLCKSLLVATGRMVGQLLLVGFYLRYLFLWDHWALNVSWILVMILATNQSILKRANLPYKAYFLPILPAYLLTMLMALAIAAIAIPAQYLLSAQYLVPLLGMVLGNLLRSNITGLQTFHRDLEHRKDQVDYLIACGASARAAMRPLLKDAMNAAISPQLAMLGTVGLVSIPGMMTGQILGGVSPWEAARYQILIMSLVFFTSVASSWLTLWFSLGPIQKRELALPVGGRK